MSPKEFFEKAAVDRRKFLIGSALGMGAMAVPGFGLRPAFAASQVVLASSIRSLSNPFHAVWNTGSEAFAKSVGAPYSALITEGNSEKGVADIRAFVSQNGANSAIGVDPNDSPDARPIVEAVAAAKGFVTTVWNKPADLHPWDFGNNYVAHMSFDGNPAGMNTAKALFDAMGGSGGFVALGGIPSNTPAIQRKAGLMEAIKGNDKVKMLDFQDADWDTTKANNIVSAWITRFGSDIKGVWAANDSMAIGALEALRAEGLAGVVPVTGIDGTKDAITAIRKGEMAATVDWDPFWIGGISLSLSYHAATGALVPEKEPRAPREFYATSTLITKADIEEYWKTHIESKPPEPDWNNLWGRFEKQIT
jgi:ribose transport system substrate-binding protein